MLFFEVSGECQGLFWWGLHEGNGGSHVLTTPPGKLLMCEEFECQKLNTLKLFHGRFFLSQKSLLVH